MVKMYELGYTFASPADGFPFLVIPVFALSEYRAAGLRLLITDILRKWMPKCMSQEASGSPFPYPSELHAFLFYSEETMP
jgi:hypothetical protein